MKKMLNRVKSTKSGGSNIAEVLASPQTAIVLVDFQPDFLEGGSLAVSGAGYGLYALAVRQFMDRCRSKHLYITQSQDWHPANHLSFAANHDKEPMTTTTMTKPGSDEKYTQMLWPIHCVQGTDGSKLLIEPIEGEYVQQKGSNRLVDSYSAFFDAVGKTTGFASHLKLKKIKNVVTLGLAGDYCVYFTAQDAIKCGFQTYCVTDLCRCVNADFDMAAEYAKMLVTCVTSEACYEYLCDGKSSLECTADSDCNRIDSPTPPLTRGESTKSDMNEDALGSPILRQPRQGARATSEGLKRLLHPAQKTGPKSIELSRLGGTSIGSQKKDSGGSENVRSPVSLSPPKNIHMGDVLSSPNTAILLIDFQHDFLEGGSLAVQKADLATYVPAVTAFLERCRAKSNLYITQSQDWHPAKHSSFASSYGKDPFSEITMIHATGQQYKQVLWPDHCVQRTHGAALLIEPRVGEYVQQKGVNKAVDSYSAFFDSVGKSTKFGRHLRSKKIKNVVVLGLAGDYCVYFCAQDAMKLGFQTFCVTDLCHCVDSSFDLKKNYSQRGIKCVTSEECLEFL